MAPRYRRPGFWSFHSRQNDHHDLRITDNVPRLAIQPLGTPLLRGHQPRANENSPPQYFLENFFRDSSSGDVAGAVSDGGAGSAAFSGSLAGAARSEEHTSELQS